MSGQKTTSFLLDAETSKIGQQILDLDQTAHAKAQEIKNKFEAEVKQMLEGVNIQRADLWSRLYEKTGADPKAESQLDYDHYKDTDVAFLVQRQPIEKTNDAPQSIN